MNTDQGYSQAYGKAFARAYDAKWSFFAQQTTPVLLDYFDRVDLPAGPVLDLCCGTGQSAALLVNAGKKVVGVDLSPHMLDHARENNTLGLEAGKARFVLANAVDFELEERFAAVVSLFDALNHLPDLAALESCFSRVHAHLERGGRFVFDMNTSKGLGRWNGINIIDDEEVTVINRGIYAGGADRAFTSITGFIRDDDGRYTRFSEVAYESVFPAATVLEALGRAGFKESYPAAIADLAISHESPESLGRVFYVATK